MDMAECGKMPPEVYGYLRGRNIKEQDVLYTAETDLDIEGNFADGYLVLTKDVLGIFQAPAKEGDVRCFRGCGFAASDKRDPEGEIEDPWEEASGTEGEGWRAEFISLEALDRLWIENCVGCNLLVGRQEEQERCLLMFTHLKKRKVAKLVRGVEQMKKGETPEFSQEAQEYCPKCGRMVDRGRVAKRKYICYECESYFRVKVPNRIRMVADPHTFEPWFTDMPMRNPLAYEGYEEKITAAREKTGLDEAVVVGQCKVFGEDIVLGICDSRFLMASMGQVVGEKITAALERAVEKRLPVFLFCCSGGARMQEGIISLMQMAKTSAAVRKLGEAGLLYCTVLTDPTTGGVTASFAMLGDIILSEPRATIGFAGRRVVEQTTKKKLPEDFQSAEFLLEHGFVDAIVPRNEMRQTLERLLRQHGGKGAML